MNTLVVLFALTAVACGSIVPLAQPPHHPALVLDPHGRPLDTAEVINARALHLQAKALEHYPIAHESIVAPVIAPLVSAHAAHGAYAAPYLAHSAYGLGLGHGHYLKKRSLGHYAYSAPIIAPAAVSHQSRVDVVSNPAIVSHAVAAPVHAVHAVAAPVYSHAIAPAAVSHQSRVDVRSSPAIVAHSALAVAPLVNAHSAYASPYLAHSALSLAGHGHYLKKRSLGHYAYSAPIVAPAAVSHQSRVDVVSSPAIVSHAVAAPVHAVHAVAAPVYAHAIAPAAVSHQSRVDVRSSPAVYAHVAPVAHSVIAAPLAHSGLLHAPLAHSASHLVHGW